MGVLSNDGGKNSSRDATAALAHTLDVLVSDAAHTAHTAPLTVVTAHAASDDSNLGRFVRCV